MASRFSDVDLRRSVAAELQRLAQRTVDRGPVSARRFKLLANVLFRASGSPVRIETYLVHAVTGTHEIVLVDETGRHHVVCQQTRALGYKNFSMIGRIVAESYGLDRIPLRNGDVVIDVGANTGDLCLYLGDLAEQQGVRLTYFGIEPGPAEFTCLERNSSTLQAVLLQVALGESAGLVQLYYTPRTADSSILETPDFEAILDVEMLTLDELMECHLHEDQEVRFLKLEAEGYELEVLQGGSRNLQRVQWIAADLGFERGLEQRATAPEVIPYLLDRGFVLERLTQPSCIRYLFRRKDVQL